MKNPKIRFKGYTDDWERRKLGEVFMIRNEKNNNRYTREDVLAVSDVYGCVNQIKFHGRSFAGEDISNYKVVRTGDIVYTKSPLQAKPYGIIKIVREETGIISPLYVVNETVNEIDSMFMYYLFDTPERTNNYLSPLVRKGAKNTMNISNEEWLCGEVTISPNEQEQKAISTFFQHLDHLITLHQRKCNEIKTLKKYMLQKMFPQNGMNIPEIRFDGFTDAWEQQELGQIVGRTYGGGTPKTGVIGYWDGNIPWIQSSNLTEHELFNANIEKYITDEGLAKSAAQLVPSNSIAVVSHVGVGKLVFMPFSYTTSQDFISLSELKTEPIFTCYSIYKKLQNDLHLVQGSAIKGITKKDLLSKEIMLPSKSEQAKIGTYLCNLDKIITLHQRKCNELQNIKKFMLQNMFV